MQKPFLLQNNQVNFPHPDLALTDPNGLLAVGGDLAPQRLINAYKNGIFPWYDEEQPLLWWSPDPRAVLFLEKLKISRSLAKAVRRQSYHISFDSAFRAVIHACATTPRKKETGTWITEAMIAAYCQLHTLGHAHSVEVWSDQGKLIGGLYGVNIGKVFCGESMFSIRTNASKIALVHLVEKLKHWHYRIIDCQIQNPHLQSLGAIDISRKKYLAILQEDREKKDGWQDLQFDK